MSTNISKARRRIWASFIAETIGLGLLIAFFIFVLQVIAELNGTSEFRQTGLSVGAFISMITLFGVAAGVYLEYRSYNMLEKRELPYREAQRIEKFLKENNLPSATFLLHLGFLPVTVVLNYPRQIVSFNEHFFRSLSERQALAVVAHEVGGHVRHFDAALSLVWEWAGMSVFFAVMHLISFLFEPQGTFAMMVGWFLQMVIPVACLVAFVMTGGGVMHSFPDLLKRYHDFRADACAALFPGFSSELSEVIVQFDDPSVPSRIAKLKELEY